jgi:phosphohistidine phosphatase
MNLFLQRHAHPVPGARDDAERGLTPAGRKQAEEMAAWLAHQIGRVDTVITSPFARAVETAEIMAEALGSHIQRTPMVEPNVKPSEAWAHIQAMAGYYSDVLVVSHHPLVGHLIDEIGGVGGISHIFEHGSIALVDSYAKELRWLVNPDLVERDEDLDNAVAEVAEAAAGLLAVSEIDAPPLGGLKHPKHANVLAPIRADVTAIMRKMFKRQGKLLLEKIRPLLREADTPKEKAQAVIPDSLPIAFTGGMKVDYSKALSAALQAGYAGLAEELGSDSAISEDVVQAYLEDHSLTKLTGALDETTVQRLRNALAEAYEKGADFEGLTQAVKDEYAGFSDVRAGMIAQTEMNAAYNAGRKQLALDMNFNEKSVDPDTTACEEICVPAVLEGWVPIDFEFEDGDGAPFHPNCDCGMNFRLNPHADAVS